MRCRPRSLLVLALATPLLHPLAPVREGLGLSPGGAGIHPRDSLRATGVRFDLHLGR